MGNIIDYIMAACCLLAIGCSDYDDKIHNAMNRDLSIKEVHMYEDGGSVEVFLQAENSGVLRISFASCLPDKTSSNPILNGSLNGRMFLGSETDMFNTLIPRHSNAEKNAMNMLNKALLKELTPKEIINMKDYNYKPQNIINTDMEKITRFRGLRSLINAMDLLNSIK
jgi:hypothetical protein